MADSRLLVAALLLLGTASVAAQAVPRAGGAPVAPPAVPAAPGVPAATGRLDAADHAESARVRALVGDLGGPELPPVLPDSPRDLLEFADRIPVTPQDLAQYAAGAPPTYAQGIVPAGAGGTGTDLQELFWYQVPGDYDANAPAVPLVIAYHGYGGSANSVAVQSTIDEECNARGWLYVAPTGIDDKLFGSPVSQMNTEAAVQWMLDNYHVDAERIYMVGFSMGGGVTVNFAARRRDPDGIMIAAVGIVSGTFDWTASYNLGTPTLKTWLENSYNFGGSPLLQAFAYQRSSALYFTPGTYHPLPGTLNSTLSMATNLGTTPTWVTWDLADTLPEVTSQEPVFVSLMTSLGGIVESHPVTGTPVTHSWAVLDELALFDFFEQHVLERTPATFHALADGDVAVSWAGLTQSASLAFSRVDGDATATPATLSATGLDNLEQIALHAQLAGLSGAGPVRVLATTAGAASTLLRVDGLGEPPAYFADTTSGALLPGDTSDPVADALLFPLPPLASWQADLVTHPLWTTDLTTSPSPVAPGGTLTVNLDAPVGASLAFLLVGFDEALAVLKGAPLTVSLAPPLLVVSLPLDGAGNVQVAGTLPNDPVLSGIELYFQSVALAGGSAIESVSSLWRTSIQ